MVAKIPNPLVVRLYEELDKRGMTVPDFSEETGIPKDRIYKWRQENTGPKAEDAELVDAWIKGEISTYYKNKYLELLQAHNSILKEYPINLNAFAKTLLRIEAKLDEHTYIPFQEKPAGFGGADKKQGNKPKKTPGKND